MRLIKKYIKELKELRGHEITGRKLQTFRIHSSLKQETTNGGSTEELDAYFILPWTLMKWLIQ